MDFLSCCTDLSLRDIPGATQQGEEGIAGNLYGSKGTECPRAHKFTSWKSM